jgi:BTB/POZ domain
MKRSASAMQQDYNTTVVKFDVGGMRNGVAVSLSTLRNSITHFPYSLFSTLFAGDGWQEALDLDGYYFVDRMYLLFQGVINILRHPHIPVNEFAPRRISPELWQCELEFWGLLSPDLSKKTLISNSPDKLVLIGEEMRRKTKEMIAYVALLMLEKSGWTSRGVMNRFQTMTIPHNYIVCDDIKLGDFIDSYKAQIKKLLIESLGYCEVALHSFYPTAEDLLYTFDGVQYSSLNHGYTLRIKMIEPDED